MAVSIGFIWCSFFSAEDSLRQSNNGDIKRLAKETDTNIEAAVLLVMKAKFIIPEIQPR